MLRCLRYLKENRVNAYLLLVIGGVASLPLWRSAAWADAGVGRQLLVVALNLLTAVIAYVSFGCMFTHKTIGIVGSMLYTWCPYRNSDLYMIGDVREGMAWSFVPIVLWGLVWLYDDCKEHKRAWLILAIGFSLLAFSSMAFFCVAAVAAVIWFVLMGKKSLCRQRLIAIGKMVLTTLLCSAWVLVPALLRMRDPAVVGALIPENFRMGGLYPAQYLSFFPSIGNRVNFARYGAAGAQEMGVGAAVSLLSILYLWSLFVKKFQDSLGKKMLIFIGSLLLLGSNLLPWDLLQNKNMLCSVVLALLKTPANFAVFFCVGMLWVACRMLQKLEERGDIRVYQGALALTVLVSFGVQQLM